MTDAEVWGELAEHMEGSGFLPGQAINAGLCDAIFDMATEGIIGPAQVERLLAQLYRRYIGRADDNGYFWPEREVTQRIRACRALMLECLERDGE